MATHTQKRPGSVKDVVPDNAPIEVVEYRLSEEELVCPKYGEAIREIGITLQKTLKLIPVKAILQRDI